MTGSPESTSAGAGEAGPTRCAGGQGSPARGRLLRLPQTLRTLFEERLPKGVGWFHIFGSTLLALIGLQVVTGILLSLNYSASTSTAWESVRYIQDRATFGGLIRGVHHWAASASIVVAALHLMRVFIYAAYRRPRQWTWVTGVFLLTVLLGFGLTGYLLPWDLKAYFGTKVATEIPGSVPVIGPYVLQLVRGGEEVSPFTLTRFYSLHVIILPATLAALLAIHLTLIRRHGITPPWRRVGEQGAQGLSFFPYQAMKDSVAIFVVVVVVFALAVSLGAPLEGKADPTSSSYVPRPDWYFLGLQQLLRIFQGKWQIFGTFIIPNVLIVGLVVLPWLDRNTARRIRSRPVALSLGAVCVFAVVSMTVAGYAAVRQEEIRMAGLAVSAPTTLETATPIVQSSADLVREGERLYRVLRCGTCHGPDREEVVPGLPPDLSYAGSKLPRAWIVGYLRDPYPIRYLSDGIRPKLRMPDYRLSDQEATALASYLAERTDESRFPSPPSAEPARRVQPPAKLPTYVGTARAPASQGRLEEGKRLFANYQCLGCHVFGSEGNRVGPDLTHVGSRLKLEYLNTFLQAPEAVIPGTAMKNFELWDDERDALVAFLIEQR